MTTFALRQMLSYRIPNLLSKPVSYSFKLFSSLELSPGMQPSQPTPKSQQIKNTGPFKAILPDIHVGPTHFKRALRSLNQVKVNSAIKNVRLRYRKHSALSLDTLLKNLSVPITRILAAYENIFKILHPYEVSSFLEAALVSTFQHDVCQATVADLTFIAREKRGKPTLTVRIISH
jgi:hypothetical protein